LGNDYGKWCHPAIKTGFMIDQKLHLEDIQKLPYLLCTLSKKTAEIEKTTHGMRFSGTMWEEVVVKKNGYRELSKKRLNHS
jgi:hypothetical protein